MKKFDFKKLLILLLALVLVFALVACNGDDNGKEEEKDPPKLSAEDYFTALWTASKSIGDTPIKADADLNFEIGLEVDIAVKTGAAAAIEYKLAIDIKAIYDRNATEDGKYSAAAIEIRDRKAGTNLLSLYYYLDDPTKIYMNAYDQKFCLEFQATDPEGDPTEANQVVAQNLTNFLTKKFVADDDAFVNNKSIDDIIMLFAAKFGPDFDLDDVLGLIFEFMGMNMGELVDLIQGLIPFEVANPNKASLLDVLKALGGVAVGNITKTETASGGYRWSGNLTSAVKTLLTNMTDTLVDGDNTTISILFDTSKDGKDLENLSLNLKRDRVVGNTNLEVRVALTELSVTETTAKASGTGLFGMKKTDYKSDYKLNLDVEVAIADAMLKLTYADDGEENFATIAALYKDDVRTIDALEAQEFAGVLRIEADAYVNLLANDNKTAAYAAVYYKPNGGTEELVVEASFTNTDGVGTAKIWMADREYAVIARDYLILNIVKALHNSNEVTAVDPDNITRAEYLAGSNGDAIIALIDALYSEARTFVITGLELQTMLWDLFFVEDAPKVADPEILKVLTSCDYIEQAIADGWVYNETTEKYEKTVDDKLIQKTEADLYKLKKLPESEFKFDFDFLQIAKIAVQLSSQSADNAFAFSLPNGIANGLLKEVTNTNNKIINFGIFETMIQTKGGITTFDSFESKEDIYAWFYKGSQSVINRMTDAGVIGAIRVDTSGDASSKGKYILDDNLNWVEADAEKTGRFNIEKSNSLANNALVGNGTWFYQNSSTISKDEARKIWAVATGAEEVVNKVNGVELTTEERNALYEECFDYGISELLGGSSFMGTEGFWLDNILKGKVSLSISYVTEDGMTINVSYTDVANKTASVKLTLKMEALTAPYTVPTSTNLDAFDETTANCVVDLSAYMQNIYDDYDEQIGD